MERVEIVKIFTDILERRGIAFDDQMTLSKGVELDSYDIVSIMLEMEEFMNVNFDDDTQILFGEANIARICDRLSEIEA